MAARKRPAAQNRAALDQLRAAAAPGAFSPSRIHGRYAVATVSGMTLHLFDWEVNFTLETFDATAHGEDWKTMVAGDQSWVARARGYLTASNCYLAAAATSSGTPTTVTFTGYADMNTGGTPIWAGAGFITRANLSVPMAMVTQEIEITGSGIPTGGT